VNQPLRERDSLKIRGGQRGGQYRTLRVGENRQNRRGVIRPSSVRLKVRNIDEKQVTNDDLRVSNIYLY